MDITKLHPSTKISLHNAINEYVDTYDLSELVFEELPRLAAHLSGVDQDEMIEVLPEEDPIETFQQGLARTLPSWQSGEHDPYAGDRKPC